MIKSASSNHPIDKIANGIGIVLYCLFSVLWMMKSYQYSVIKFLEEIQLFRTDFVYFSNYISQPGGIAGYIGSFLTQFYQHPLTGAILLTACFLLVYVLLFFIYKSHGAIIHFFILPFITPIFLLFIYNTENAMHITTAHFVSIVLALASFLLYLKLNKPFRYIGGIVLYLAMYLATAGNALLFVVLLLIKEWFETKKSYGFLLLMVIMAMIIPYISYRLIYVTTLKEAYLTLTPFTVAHKNLFYYMAWFSIPVIYLFWRIMAQKSKPAFRTKPVFINIVYLLIAGGLCWWGVRQYNKHEMEYIMHMAYETEQGNWDQVIEMGQNVKFRNAVPIAYFMNIAHAEKGNLAEELFRYRQTGTYGLFNSWSIHHTTTLYIGELYYRMGVPAIAEQCAFEAMVTSPDEHSSKALRRLVQTNMLRKDMEGFEKYIRLFEKSPVYKHWAAEQRVQFEKALNDPNYKIPDLPETAVYHNFFFSSGQQEQNLLALMAFDPENRKAFEYFAAFLLLKKDLLSFEILMNMHYEKMKYSKLPTAFEEALLILAYNDRADLIPKYGIRQSTMDRFASVNKDVQKAVSKKAQQAVQEKYKNTYWPYYKYTKPMMLEDIPGMMVY